MYESLTVESIKADILSRITTDIDTREGSYTNDMVSTVAYEIWNVYQSLAALIPVAFVDETSGIYIGKRAEEYGITEKAGTKATVTLSFTGTDDTVVPAGKVFLTTDGLQFETDEAVTIADGAASVSATAEEVGTMYNVEAGDISLQLMSLYGLSTFTNEDAAEGGADTETDAALFGRLDYFRKNPATSGNTAHYMQWATAVEGVGSAKVIPLWDGAGTVKVLVVGDDNEPVDSAIVTACQEYIDSLRPIGADVTVLSATGLDIDIAATVVLDGTASLSEVQSAFETALNEYLQDIAFDKYTLVYNRIAYMLLDIDGVTDYTALTINNGTANITIDDDEVPVMGTVVISE